MPSCAAEKLSLTQQQQSVAIENYSIFFKHWHLNILYSSFQKLVLQQL